MPVKKSRETILIVDDDLAFARKVSDSLSLLGLEVMVTNDPLAALEILDSFSFELVIAGCGMAKLSGLEVLSRVRERHPALPVYLICANPDQRVREDCLARGAAGFYLKPLDFEQMLLSVYRQEYARLD
ncbi:response regulator [bacterium]|nr:response regulator [bacterium]